MATPMTAAQYLAQLKKWGIAFKAYKVDWATHNRNSKGAWGPVNGVMLHHTGSDTHNPGLLWNGYGALPGPLCHAGNGPDGVVWGIGWGRANHAGLGDSSVLSRVIAENYTGILRPTKADTDGNSRFYGMEVEYSGSHGMGKAQYLSMIRWAAAICQFHGWTAKSVIAHGEWQPGKWDPGYAPGKLMDMNAVRNDVAALLKAGPVQPAPAPTKPAPAPVPKVYDLKVGDILLIGNSTLKVTEVK